MRRGVVLALPLLLAALPLPTADSDAIFPPVAEFPLPRNAVSAVWTGTHVHVFGGSMYTGPDTLVWRYDPATAELTPLPGTLPARSHMVAAWTGSVVYLLGGHGDTDTGVFDGNRIVKYDPATGTITVLDKRLPGGRERAFGFWDARTVGSGASARCTQGCAYVLGGEFRNTTTDQWTFYDDILRFDPARNEVVRMNARLPANRVSAAAAFDGRHLWILGGQQPPQYTIHSTVWKYDPIADAVTQTSARLPRIQFAGAAIWDGARVLDFGGRGLTASGELVYHDTILAFDPATLSVSTLGLVLPTQRFDIGAAFDGRSTHLFGGYHWQGGPIKDVLKFDPRVPSPPASVTATRGPGVGAVSVAWTAPPHADGLTGYRVWRLDDAGGRTVAGTTAPGTRSFVDSGLPQGRLWTYEVRAFNPDGEGAPSARVSAFPAGLPGAPGALAARPGPGAGQVTLTWTTPAEDGGHAVSSYRVYRDGLLVGSPTTATFTNGGLANDAAYAYAVSAVNALGEGPRSPEVAARTPRTPSAPPAPSAASGLRPGDIEVRWSAPADDGGSAVLGYRVYRGSRADEVAPVATVTNARSWTDSGHAGGVEYWYRVAAINAVGEGARSAADAGSAIAPSDVKVKTTPGAVVYRDADDDNVVDPGEAVVALP